MDKDIDKKKTFISRRAVLKGVGTMAGLTAVSALFGFPYWWMLQGCSNKDSGNRTSLQGVAATKGLIYGAASGCNLLTADKEFAAHFANECGILVPENELKWATLRPTPDSYNFAPADCLAEFAQKNNMQFRGTTLVWNMALPNWFQNTVNSENAEEYLRDHIAAVVGRYAGKMHSWDVVNEVVWPSDQQPDGPRNSPWLQLLGPKYIDIAFRATAQADPHALLVLNQNHLEYDSKENEDFRVATLNLLKQLKSSGTPVHALGIQAHLGQDAGSFNSAVFKAFLRNVASLDLKIMITELDVTDQKLPYDITIRDRIVAGMYEDFLSVVLDEPAVIGVVTWGLSDKYTWLAEYAPRADKAAVRPLPLDDKFNRKLAWNAIERAFDKAPIR